MKAMLLIFDKILREMLQTLECYVSNKNFLGDITLAALSSRARLCLRELGVYFPASRVPLPLGSFIRLSPSSARMVSACCWSLVTSSGNWVARFLDSLMSV